MTSREPDDAEVDAAFASIVAGLRSDNPEALRDGTDDHWADDHPLFSTTAEDRPPAPDAPRAAVNREPEPMVEELGGWRTHHAPDDDELPDEPPPADDLPPWRPSPLTVVGLAAVVFSVVATLVVISPAPVPGWLGWAALVAMAGGLIVLFTRLPNTRDDDDPDDGARV